MDSELKAPKRTKLEKESKEGKLQMSQTMEGGAMRGRRLAAIFGGFALCVGAVVVCLKDSGAGSHPNSLITIKNPNHRMFLHDDRVAGYVCIELKRTSARLLGGGKGPNPPSPSSTPSP